MRLCLSGLGIAAICIFTCYHFVMASTSSERDAQDQDQIIPHHLTDINITLHDKYHIDFNADRMFPYLINNPTVCSGVEDMLYLIMVIVAPTQEGYRRRLAIRKTWGQNDFLKDSTQGLYFY